ncbi:oligosaccharyl transferase subunit OST3/OST6 family [Fomitopsis serialis]|uniref:oligosaccharyl transferase subunit OST3/OST6 family n=1 Tax=Fomitopsis serialis TaxID=139415 RepID=UPI0020078197|nr:oligosaccharyl transferase subunit OST3/OST6 family [Neoantrodia serialis]KAH9926214.1 oligosaccharyl transferase subunit OST3/OST6 family [Neoantrodia serialis]
MLLPLLALFLLPFCIAASAEADHAQLVKLAAANNGVIRLDEHSYQLLTNPKRTWSASVQFTALDKRRKCGPCKEFDPSWNAVAKAWSKVSAAERNSHFFGTVDFDHAMTIFQQLGLQSAPVVQVWPATDGPRRPANGRTNPIALDFSQGFDAAPLAEQLSHYTPVAIPYKAPIDYSRIGSGLFVLLSFVAALRFISPILKSRWTWAAITVLTSLVMTSGFMFVRIRGMPYTGPNGQWVAGGYQSQYGQEVQVVSMIYGTLAAGFLMLTLVVPSQMSPSRQRMQVYLWTGVIFVMYSVLVSLFKEKNKGYPFRLLL